MRVGLCVRTIGVVLVVAALLSLPSLQAQSVNGTILGAVLDPSGATVAGATVTVTNTATGVARTVTTNAQGRYRVPELIVGTYDVKVTQQGFETAVQTGVPVVVGAEREVDVTMAIGQAQQTVTVAADVAQVSTTSAAVSTL